MIELAEWFGIPAGSTASGHESTLSYEDDSLGSGRVGYRLAQPVTHAMELGGDVPTVCSADPLPGAFPVERWRWKPLG